MIKQHHPLLDAFAEQRTRTVHTLANTLRADPRIAAAWLFGSLGRREEDALSDIDIWVVVRDNDAQQVIENRRKFVTCLGKPVHIQEAPQNAPVNGGYLLTLYATPLGIQHIDWYWEPASQAKIPRDARLLFDRAELPYYVLASHPPRANVEVQENPVEETQKNIDFFWSMVPITGKYIARRNVWGALGMIQMLRGVMFHIEKHANLPSFAELDLPPEGEQFAILNLLRALARGVENIHPVVRKMGVTIDEETPLHIYRYLDQMELILRGTA